MLLNNSIWWWRRAFGFKFCYLHQTVRNLRRFPHFMSKNSISRFVHLCTALFILYGSSCLCNYSSNYSIFHLFLKISKVFILISDKINVLCILNVMLLFFSIRWLTPPVALSPIYLLSIATDQPFNPFNTSKLQGKETCISFKHSPLLLRTWVYIFFSPQDQTWSEEAKDRSAEDLDLPRGSHVELLQASYGAQLPVHRIAEHK